MTEPDPAAAKGLSKRRRPNDFERLEALVRDGQAMQALETKTFLDTVEAAAYLGYVPGKQINPLDAFRQLVYENAWNGQSGAHARGIRRRYVGRTLRFSRADLERYMSLGHHEEE